MELRQRFAFMAFAAAALAAPALAADEDDLRRIEEERREAIRTKDIKALERIYAPEFTAVASNGSVITRAQLFRAFQATDPSVSFVTDDIRISRDGDTAIFVGKLVARKQETLLSSSRFTHVFVKRDGKWVCIAGQSTPIQAPAAPPKPRQ